MRINYTVSNNASQGFPIYIAYNKLCHFVLIKKENKEKPEEEEGDKLTHVYSLSLSESLRIHECI